MYRENYTIHQFSTQFIADGVFCSCMRHHLANGYAPRARLLEQAYETGDKDNRQHDAESSGRVPAESILVARELVRYLDAVRAMKVRHLLRQATSRSGVGRAESVTSAGG